MVLTQVKDKGTWGRDRSLGGLPPPLGSQIGVCFGIIKAAVFKGVLLCVCEGGFCRGTIERGWGTSWSWEESLGIHLPKNEEW